MISEENFKGELGNIFKNLGITEPKDKDSSMRFAQLMSIVLTNLRILKEDKLSIEAVIIFINDLIMSIISREKLDMHGFQIFNVLSILVHFLRKIGYEVNVEDIVYKMSTLALKYTMEDNDEVTDKLMSYDTKAIQKEFSDAIGKLNAVDLIRNKKKNE